uniref:EF-hand domain-containing protein n=1 Tax=Panagrolaimus superbus TaxID=310955 RepID=A0A914YHP8_9BILA
MRSGPRFVQLSEQFVDSLRAFFDSLDLERTGFVSYENICHRWRQFPPRLTKILPPNFLQHLAHTVPSNGFVSFERFLAGVRISVAEQQLQQQQQKIPPSSKRGEMKRVQSEGGNLHINGLEEDDDDDLLYGSSGMNNIYGNYVKIQQQKPVMGVKGSSTAGKPPPPNYGSNNDGGISSTSAIDFNDNKVQLRPKKHGNERNGTYSRSNGPSQFRPVSTNSVSSSSSMAEIRWRDSRLSNTSTPLGDTVSATPTSNHRHSSYLPEHSSQVRYDNGILSA